MFGWLLKRKKRPDDRNKLGRWGENYCRKFLESKGLRTLCRNYSCKAGEIDLIMVDKNGTIVFVEVKTRTDENFQPVESVITETKKRHLIRTAKWFLKAERIEERPMRFDVVSIVADETLQLRHYENAFVP